MFSEFEFLLYITFQANFVQKKWKPGVPEQTNECEECNCHGHSTRCLYDEQVDERHESMDLHGNYEGKGLRFFGVPGFTEIYPFNPNPGED